eukprot:gene8156-11038_t
MGNGAGVESLNNKGTTTSYSKENEHNNTTKLLYLKIERQIKQGSFFQSQNQELYKQLIYDAINMNQLDILELLLPHGNIKLIYPLHIAAKLGKMESLELLISAGFNGLLVDNDGNIPLHYSSKNNSFESSLCAQCLLYSDNKKSINYYDNNNNLPQHIAVSHNNYYVLKLLLENKIKISTPNGKGYTIIQIAKKNNYQNLIELIQNFTENNNKNDRNRYNNNNNNHNSNKPPIAVNQDRIMEIWERFFENAFSRLALSDEDICDNINTIDNYAKLSVNKNNSYDNYDDMKVSSYSYDDDYSNKMIINNKKKQKNDNYNKNENKDDISIISVRSSNQDYEDYDLSNNSFNIQTSYRWFEWIICYNYDNNYYDDSNNYHHTNEAYYVINKRTYLTRWLTDHINQCKYDLILPMNLSIWDNYDVMVAKPYPVTIKDTILDGWLTYYDYNSNTCQWMSIPTKCCENYLPLNSGYEYQETLISLGFEPNNDNNDNDNNNNEENNNVDRIWYKADQSCAYAWILVIIANVNNHKSDSKSDDDSQEQFTKYYMNRLTGQTIWNEPSNWIQLVTAWDGWMLCCNEDAPLDLFWFNPISGESIWADSSISQE